MKCYPVKQFNIKLDTILKLTQALQHNVELTGARGPCTLFSTNLKVNCYTYDKMSQRMKCKNWHAPKHELTMTTINNYNSRVKNRISL